MRRNFFFNWNILCGFYS